MDLRPRIDSPRLTLTKDSANDSQILHLNAPSSAIPAENQIARIEDFSERHALRELLLSKITTTLRSNLAER